MNEFNLFEDDKSSVAGYVKGIGTVILILISAVATFGFFSQFNANFLSSILPQTLAAIGAGAVGVALLEGGVIWWHYLSLNDADTQKQINLAKWGYVFSLVLSVGITAVYMLLTSSLIGPFITVDFMDKVSLAGLVIIVAAVVVQFVLSREYDRASSNTTKSKHQANIRAAQNKASHVIEFEHTQQRLERSVDEIRRQLPDTAQRQATRARDAFLADQTELQQNGRG